MTDQANTKKTITLRLPEDFWDRAKTAAHDKRTSLSAAAVTGMSLVLEIEPPEEPSTPDEPESSAP